MERETIGEFSCIFAIVLYWIGFIAWIGDVMNFYGFISTTLISIAILVINALALWGKL